MTFAPTRRWMITSGLALFLSSCETGGHFSVAGYSTRPLHRTDIRTVRVPIFKNLTFRDSTRDGLEMRLTRAVVEQIQMKTPWRVVGADCEADTELTGTLALVNKNSINRNQLNEVREGLTTFRVDVVWRDLRTGEILSQPRRRPEDPPLPADAPPPAPVPVSVYSEGRFIPELGESPTTAYKKNIDRLATQIVSLMEQNGLVVEPRP